jgi:hypothetical protein
MPKTHTIQLTDEQHRLMLFALGFSEGAMRGTCQFEVADALTTLLRQVKLPSEVPSVPAAALKANHG